MVGTPDGGTESPFRWSLRRLAQNIADVVMGGLRHVEGNIVPVCICGAIMFPVYWLVWKYLFPQPYENLPLRLVGSGLCLLLAIKDWWPTAMRRYLPVIWLGMILYALPFFFTFMLLQNNTSDIWLMSTLSALFLMVLLLDWISLIVCFFIGSLLAWRLHLLVSPGVTGLNLYVEFIPVLLFAVIAGTVFNYKAAGLRQAQERARLDIGSLIAKEIQSPLFSIRTNAVSLSKFLPALIRSYAPAAKETAEAFTQPQLAALERVPTRIDDAVEQISSVLEILLMQNDQAAGDTGASRSLSITRCVDDAIGRLPLKNELDRSRLIFHRENDFRVGRSPALISHLLTGVIEASFNLIYDRTGGELVIELGQTGRWNYVRLKDSSVGLRPPPAAKLPRFGIMGGDKEFSNRPDLAFAKLVLERIGGSVTHNVEFSRTTDVVLWFPRPGA